MSSKWLEILLSDKTFSIVTFLPMICFGMFWSIPASLLYELKSNINQGMRVLGYLVMTIRFGKMVGHLLAIKICGYFQTKRCSEIHLISMTVQCLCVILTPLCTHWALLGVDWIIIGLTLGIIESNTVFFNAALNKKSAHKYTNIYYFTFSLGSALTPIIVDATRRDIHDAQEELFAVCWIIGGFYIALNSILLFVLILRRKHGICIEQMEDQKLPENQNLCVVSNICIALATFCFMSGRTVLEVFLLPYASYAKADLNDKQTYSVIQCIFGSQLFIRFIGIFVALILDKTSALLIFWNTCIVIGVCAQLGFQDNTYLGIIVTMTLFGFVLGAYQNTLLNWMTDRMYLNNRNTAPFFFGTVFGSTFTPAVVPHIIKNSDGSINVESYQILVEVLMSLSVLFCTGLLTTELGIRGRGMFNSTVVEEVNIVPESDDVAETSIKETFSDLTLPTAITESRAASRPGGIMGFISPLSPII